MKKLSLQELNRVSTDEFKAQQKTPIIIILDNIRSGMNVGSVFRTADAFALEKIYLCGITAQPPHREILKTAIGASKSVDWAYAPSAPDLISELKRKNIRVVAVEQVEGSTALQAFQLNDQQTIALVFGNEVKGVSDEVMEIMEESIEIPQFGTKHSLNISVCAGVVIWEIFKKIRYAGAK